VAADGEEAVGSGGGGPAAPPTLPRLLRLGAAVRVGETLTARFCYAAARAEQASRRPRECWARQAGRPTRPHARCAGRRPQPVARTAHGPKTGRATASACQ
jgi:hypothetical protein